MRKEKGILEKNKERNIRRIYKDLYYYMRY